MLVKELLNPKSIVIIGGSNDVEKSGKKSSKIFLIAVSYFLKKITEYSTTSITF